MLLQNVLGVKAFDFKALRISKSIKNIKATHHSQNTKKPFKLYTS
jgi:hypothetical protein